MKNIQNRCFCWLLCLLITGCKLDAEIGCPQKIIIHWDQTAEKFYKSPKIIKPTPKNQNIDKIIMSITDNKSGWTPSLLSYAPYISIIGNNNLYKINITPTLVIINYKTDIKDDKSIQLVKKSTTAFFEEVLKLLE